MEILCAWLTVTNRQGDMIKVKISAKSVCLSRLCGSVGYGDSLQSAVVYRTLRFEIVVNLTL